MMTGLTLEQLAEEIGVSVRTLYRWQREHDEFCQALKEGKLSADSQVADSLFRRAMGFDAEETHVEADGKGAPQRIRKVKKRIAPDVTACIFWLKNRRPDLWRDTYNMEGALNVAVNEALQKTLDTLERVLPPEAFRRALSALAADGGIGAEAPKSNP